MMAVEVVINCKHRSSIHPDLLPSLENQSCPYRLKIIESSISPTRLSQVQDPETIYIFLDQDVVLPHADYLKELAHYCQTSSSQYFFTGAYLSHPEIPYLAHCYNSQVNSWILASDIHQTSSVCENAPGGIWIVSGKIFPYLTGWAEPEFWAGEDTYTIRWLQARGISIQYTPLADLYHYPLSGSWHFLRRAFKQGIARRRYNLGSKRLKINWKFHFRHYFYWPGWSIHQLCVALGSIRSFMAKNRP